MTELYARKQGRDEGEHQKILEVVEVTRVRPEGRRIWGRLVLGH